MPVESPSLKELFLTALAVAPAQRAAWLERACGPDVELRQRVALMLAAHETPQSLLDQLAPAAEAPAATDACAAGTVERLSRQGSEEAGMVLAGRYKLLELLGEGGMGAVWMAEQQQPVRRKVAVKVIKQGMDSKQVLARFEAERQALALMDHPHIARVLDAGTTDEGARDEGRGERETSAACLAPRPSPLAPSSGRQFFVMELVKGVPITRYCDEQRLTPRQRLELFLPVCQAIQHAHHKGIIHRDIKPSNVLVAPYDGKPVVKVIDFGVAKATGPKLTEWTLHTGLGVVVGTVEYMSPEQAGLNQLDVDTRSDVYSLGVLLYELLAGSPPFTRQELEKAGLLEMLRVIREQEPAKPSTRLSTAEGLPTLAANRGTEPKRLTALVRGELDWIVMKALEKDRGRRYETANGLAMDLQRHLADEPVLACPPSVGYRLKKFLRRNQGRVLAATLVVLALVVGIVGTSVGLLRAEGRRREAETAKEDLVIQRDLAQRQRERADRNLARARKAVQDYLTATALDPRLQTADFHALRKSLLATAVPFYEEFVMQQADDPAIEADRGRAYGELATVRMNMGETDKALSECQKAEEIFVRLAAQYPTEPSHWANLAVSLDQQGMLLKALGRHAEAEDAYRESLAYREQLVVELPNVPIYPYELAGSLQHLSTLLTEIGKADEARATQQQALDVSRKLSAEFPDTPAHFSMLAANHGNMGNRLLEIGQWEQAEAHYMEARAIFRKLAVAYPKEPKHQEDLAVHLTMVGGWHLNRNQWNKAEEILRDATTIWAKLARDFPSLTGHRQGLARACNNQGVALTELTRYMDAEAAHRQALDLRNKLSADFPGVPGYQEDLARSYNNLGILLRAQGKPAEARAAYEQAVTICLKLCADYPNVVEHPVELGGTYVVLGSLDVDADPEAALAWCDKAIAAVEPVHARDQKNVSVRTCLGKADVVRAQALTKLNRLPEALEAWDRAKRLDAQLAPGVFGESRLLPNTPAEYVSRGVGHSRKGELNQAIADYTQAIMLDPKLALAYRNRGRDYSALGQYDRAIADFRESIRLEPNKASAYCDRARCYIQKEEYDKALADCTKAIQLDSNLALAYRHRGDVYAEKGDKRAIADFTKAIQLDPADTQAYFKRAEVYREQKQHDLAIADYTEAIRREPSNALAHSGRGNAHADKKEFSKAVADFTEALRLQPQSPDLRYALYLMRGAVYGEMGKHEAAVADYTEAIRLDPDAGDAYIVRAAAYRALGDKAKADADDRKVKALAAWGDAYNQGIYHYNKGEYAKAIRHFTDAIRVDPRIVEAYLNRGGCHGQLGENDKAIDDYSAAIRLDPSSGPAYFGRGFAYLNQEDFDRAIADLTEAIRLNGNDPGPYYYRGHAYSAQEDYAKAVADFTEVIRLDPTNSSAYSDRGNSYTEPEERPLAIADFQSALRLDADNADAHCGLAWLLATSPEAKLRDGRRALEHARKACELTEWKEPVYLDALAAAYAEIGNFKEAIQWVKKAMKLPDYPKDELERAQERLKLYDAGKPYRDE